MPESVTGFSTDITQYGTPGAVKRLREKNAIFRALIDTLPQMIWSTDASGMNDYFNARWYDFTGVPEGTTEGDRWSDAFHADYQAEAQRRWAHAVATGGPYEIEHLLKYKDGGYRWVVTRGSPVRDETGAIVRWIGSCTDIDAAKRDAEQNAILSRELSHRIKNIFAVINGLISLSPREGEEAERFAIDLQGRIAALGRAHEFVRPHSEESRPEVGDISLTNLMNDILRPYPAMSEGRIAITGDMIDVDDRSATPVALVFHELATNAAKYGALSMPCGRVAIHVEDRGEDTLITWRESNGPPIKNPPTHIGFGSELVELSIGHQLGGHIEQTWSSDGLCVTMTVPHQRFARK